MTATEITQKIIVVDDQENFAEGIAAVLETNGFDVAVDLSLEEAVAAIENTAP
jgi:DNA-binding response OmpR family regulator